MEHLSNDHQNQHNGGKVIVEQILASKKSRTVRVRVRNQRRKVKVTRSINSTIIDYTVLTIDIKVSKEGMSPPSPSLVALDFMGWEEGVAGEL